MSWNDETTRVVVRGQSGRPASSAGPMVKMRNRMKRDKPYRSLLAQDAYLAGASTLAESMTDRFATDEIDHERARQLILEQNEHLLAAPDANALAEHLLVCDRCYRFAQEVAARERRRMSSEVKHP